MEKTPCQPQVGADVEAFVYCVPTKSYVPCVQLLPGTKDNPYPLTGLSPGFAVQEDNVMAEFNIPPATTGGDFAHYIMMAWNAVGAMLPPDHRLEFKPWALFRPKDLLSPQARMIGCQPDFNAYTGGEVRLNPPKLGLYRGAGGHVHLGGDFQCPDFVAALFAELFISVCCGLHHSKGDKRAVWYGRPGIYRPKPYGIEYRTPSCTWAKSPDMAEFVGSNALRCAQWLTSADAVDIQNVFRRITWKDVAAYVGSETNADGEHSKTSSRMRAKIMDEAMTAGLPI